MKPTVVIGGTIVAVFLAAAMPVSAQVQFTLTFDENGNATLQINGGSASSDPGYIDSNGFLAYNLPAFVLTGDVAIGNPGVTCTSATTCSDGLRFLQFASSPGGYAMEFMSAPGGNQLADTGFAANFNFSAVGTTENSDGSFSYMPCGSCATDNCYIEQNSTMPEPASLALFTPALLGLAFVFRRKRT